MPDQFFPYKMFELHRKLMELTYLEDLNSGSEISMVRLVNLVSFSR